MNELTHYSNYEAYKQALDTEMLRTAEGFVRIGYLLKYAQETNIINEGGYENVNEFAKAEYGIDASQVSRFINIHERFGIQGEARLQDRYVNHGVAKLGIMLTLPDAINEEIGSDYTKEEIKQIKAEVEAEQKISDIEVMCEEKDHVQQSLPEGLQQVVYQLIHDEPKLYERMYNAITLEDMKETLAPSGENTYSVRIPGTGRIMMFIKANENVTCIDVRRGEKTYYEWQQLYEVLEEYFGMGGDAKTSWENVFKEDFPEEKKEIAPVQAQEEPKPETKPVKKESKVKVVSKPEVKKEEPKEEVVEQAEQLPGQDNIMNHPEYLPEDMKADEVLTGEVENIEDADEHNVQQASEEIAPVQPNNTVIGYKAAISGAINRLGDIFRDEDWDKLIVEAEKMAWRAKQIKLAENK